MRRPVLLTAALLTLALGASCAAESEPDASAPSAETAAVDPVMTFATFAKELPADGPLPADAIADGLRRLAGAAATLGAIRPELAVDLRVGAEHVVLNPAGTDVTVTIRDALTRVADSLDEAQNGAALEAAARAIEPGRPLTEQSERMRQYFQLAADALAAQRS